MDAYEYSNNFKKLIEKERQAEIDFHTNEIKIINGFKREKKGRCFTNMKRQEIGKLESDSIFRFVKNNSEQLPHNEFSIGTNVLISVNNPLDSSLKGVVVQKTAMSIDIYIPSQSNIIYKNSLRIDVYVNDSTFTIQKEVLSKFKDWSFEKGILKDIIIKQKKPELGDLPSILFYDNQLNSSQSQAVKNALQEKQMYLIQGPPGTGKTKTSIEIIRQHLKLGKTVLVSADSNMAVDNIMLGLLKSVDVIRIGESPKIMEEIQEHTLNNIIRRNFQYRIVDEGLSKIQKLRTEQRQCIIPNKKNSKGLSYFQIKKFAERDQSDFGISENDIKSMAKWIIAQERIKELQFKVDKIKEKIIKECISKASVICTTNTNANSKYLDNIEFDLVLIDEAGQSTEPSCLIPISKSKKVILVGDHKQLPPTILSNEAKELSVSLFERMMNFCRHTLLDTQYRMHPIINNFASNEFYNGELKSADMTQFKELKDKIFDKNIVFVESNSYEEKHKGATSYFNQGEIDKVFDIVVKYSQSGLNAKDIGVICPYSEQSKKLKDRMPFVEVNTIDGFQGREKNIIIMSLTRSNERGEIGFLKDLRRLNVALTRAIFELIVIGNPKSISNEPTYERFISYVKENGLYIQESNFDKIVNS
jgi:predicted DNA helicase